MPVGSENRYEGARKGAAVTQRMVEIEAADGTCPAALSFPVGEGPWPAVIMFPDAGGMRDSMRQMGERLSGLGYVVLVPDFYYRNGPYEPVDMRTAFSTKETAEKIMGMMQGYKVDMVVSDAGTFVDFLESLPETKPGGVGTTGYCMGGRLSLITAGNLGGAHRCRSLLPWREPGQGRRPGQSPPQGQRHQSRCVRGGGDRGPIVPRRAKGPAGEVAH